MSHWSCAPHPRQETNDALCIQPSEKKASEQATRVAEALDVAGGRVPTVAGRRRMRRGSGECGPPLLVTTSADDQCVVRGHGKAVTRAVGEYRQYQGARLLHTASAGERLCTQSGSKLDHVNGFL